MKKERGLFSASYLRRGGTLVAKPIFPFQCKETFLFGGRGKEHKDQEEGVEMFSMYKPAQSIPIRISKLVK